MGIPFAMSLLTASSSPFAAASSKSEPRMCVNFRPTTSSPRDGAEFSLRGELLRAACCEAERWASGAEAGMELADPSLVDGDTASVAAGVCGVEARMGGDEDEDAFSFDIEMVVLRSSTKHVRYTSSFTTLYSTTTTYNVPVYVLNYSGVHLTLVQLYSVAERVHMCRCMCMCMWSCPNA